MKLEFRYFDSKNNEMIYSDPTESQDIFFERWEITPKASPIMIYTSVHDINDKKIFAGDIVRYHEPCLGGEPDMIGYVQYDEAAFWVTNERAMMSNPLFSETAELTVLGNIYKDAGLFKRLIPVQKNK